MTMLTGDDNFAIIEKAISDREIKAQDSLIYYILVASNPGAREYNFSIIAPKITENADVMDAVQLLMESGLNSIPVFQKDKLVGIVTRMDVIRNISEIDKNAERTKKL